MAPVTSLSDAVNQQLTSAISASLPEASADALLRRSDRADFQANGILALAKKAKANPRDLATQVVSQIVTGDVIKEVEVSGPGFLNVTLTDKAITENLAARYEDGDRLGVPLKDESGTTVIDYAQPNVAKEMHVGHLRSAVIGDALRGMLDFTGEKTIGRHHIGDWGTQFGMLIQYLIENPGELAPPDEVDGEQAMSNLNRVYKASRVVFDSDEEFKERARKRVVALQSGDKETLELWQQFVDESKVYFYSVFEKLDMEIRDEEIVGESAYNEGMPETARLLEEMGVAVRSEGALVVFFDEIRGKDDQPVPLIVQKADGGFGYAASDLTAIRNRVTDLHATTLLYVVDVRQSLHFKMVFEAARRAGWLSDGVTAHNMGYGTVLGADGKPFKTREGETVKLEDLLDEAVERATAVVREKAEKVGLTEEEIVENGRYVGIGAVKYADLSTSPNRDYKFDLDQMVSLNGDTSVYLQYAYARIQSILRKAGASAAPTAHPELELAPAERALGLHLDAFGNTVFESAAEYAPHRLAAYLYQLASHLTTFYDQCPVLKADTPEQTENRLFLVDLTARTLHKGMALLGIRTPERL
ncbi:arginyl-tRNA synthetase [Streptomyces canus]|uniref:Arginine--tRNA ligase n=1 Tax=Streptomyces canus TaxID=58343 RepID=A0A101SFL4_9ACTN|nr:MULTISPECIES: arginine--tRNA ligase [Streptomyces]KUN73404.1 arginyl-tRNA synthetase [Streptomyces canus]MDI5908033.1 arginine--tRNA ligase [Streptomyces sp. 12257]